MENLMLIRSQSAPSASRCVRFLFLGGCLLRLVLAIVSHHTIPFLLMSSLHQLDRDLAILLGHRRLHRGLGSALRQLPR